jgi:uncharacterized protein (TIGR00369 family)
MHPGSSAPSATDLARPFSGGTGVEPLGDGRFLAEVGPYWMVGPKAHGGLLMVLLAKAGTAAVDEAAAGPVPVDPLAVSADFLRAPEPGPVERQTEVVKVGRTVSVASVRMTQDGRTMLAATVTAGQLPEEEPRWVDLPDMPAEPPAEAIDPVLSSRSGGPVVFGLAESCDLRLDPATTSFARGEQSSPVLRGWARTRNEPVDVLFALLAGDILPPTVFNVTGRFGWAPTVQMTSLQRARPAPGWLRIEARSAVVAGSWFDEDVTVVDSAGRLVSQTRQLALAPLAT